ncbi:MAG: SDR family oxidoreductase [Anaerolineae bacterium]
MDINDQVAIVTGGAVRVGRALALALAGKGARVVVHYGRSAGPALEVVEQIEAQGGQALAVQADLGQPSQAPAIVERAVERFGRADILVNSAAIFQPGTLADTTEENWDRHFNINLKSPVFLCQAFAAQVGDDRRAHIVNITDFRASLAMTGHLAYTLTKSSLITLTRMLARELGPNIQVNAIALGAILPPPGKDQAYLDKLAENIPLRRVGSPGEVARALVYLLESEFVSGEVTFVTGGEHLAR